MYKLFLCLRYLKKLLMAYFAIICVALCVAMMLIVVSVMNGFLDKIQVAAKGLFGDIVIEAPSRSGIGRYDQFIAELKQKVPEVEAATPFITSYGLLMIPGEEFHQTIQIAGIRLPERVNVTSFGQGLFVQKGMAQPTFDPSIDLMLRRMADDIATVVETLRKQGTEIEEICSDLTDRDVHEFKPSTPALNETANERLVRLGEEARQIMLRLEATAQTIEKEAQKLDDGEEAAAIITDMAAKRSLARRIFNNSIDRRLSYGRAALLDAQPHQEKIAKLQRQLDAARVKTAGRYEGPEYEAEMDLREALQKLVKPRGFQSPTNRVILGLGVSPLTFRTPDGQTMRVVSTGENIVLAVIPLGQRDSMKSGLKEATFTIVDDCLTDVAHMDAKTVYAPFATLQRLNDMHATYDPDEPGKIANHARCSQIHIKVTESHANGQKLVDVRNKVLAAWQDFYSRFPDASVGGVMVMTWRQHQQPFVGPIEQQRTLSVIMFSVISLVAVVLIFVIFYMIVYQKIRDIGVLKAIGASSSGVAWIFLAYGAAVGLVGSVLGTIGGYYFVKYINTIQDKVDQWFGFRVWSREVFMFEKIPNQVKFSDAAWIIAFAILFGLLGAIVPAVQAARKQPVEALRYE